MEILIAVGAIGSWLVFDGVTRATAATRPGGGLGDLLAEAGIGSSPRLFVSICITSGAVAMTLAMAASASIVLGVAAGCLGAYAPIARARSRKVRRRSAHREAWPDAIAAMIAAVRSGATVASACVDVVERSPSSLRPAWDEFRATYRATGNFGRAIDAMMEEAADPIGDRVGAILLVVHDSGGTELVPVLRALAESVRAELRVVREVEARWSWTVTAARVAAAAPWVVLALMSTRPEAAAAYTSPAGTLVLLSGAVATLIGYRLMLRVARLPSERRLAR